MGKPGGPAGATEFVVSALKLCSWVILPIDEGSLSDDKGFPEQSENLDLCRFGKKKGKI